MLGHLTLSMQQKQPVSVRITKMAQEGGVVPECLALALVQEQAIRSPVPKLSVGKSGQIYFVLRLRLSGA
jgi:hypothetical protein